MDAMLSSSPGRTAGGTLVLLVALVCLQDTYHTDREIIGAIADPCFDRLLQAESNAVPKNGSIARPDATPIHGGLCFVCEREFEGDGYALMYRGRKVEVCSDACREAFLQNAEPIFAKQEARGALFDEKSTNDRSLFGGWMWFGVYVLVGLVSAAIATYVALSKGLRPLPWLFAGLFANVFALLVLSTRPRGDLSRLPEGVPPGLRKIPTTSSPLACPACGRENHPSATQCTGCGATLRARIDSEAARVLKPARTGKP